MNEKNEELKRSNVLAGAVLIGFVVFAFFMAATWATPAFRVADKLLMTGFLIALFGGAPLLIWATTGFDDDGDG